LPRIDAFEKFPEVYDRWFEENEWVYKSELEAARQLLPGEGKGLEIGTGTGRFAPPLGISIGVEPSPRMAAIARLRGLTVIEAACEALPFDNGSFDYILLVTTICFVDDPPKCLSEIHRVLKPGGNVVIGFIDGSSELGKIYKAKKGESKFYNDATFYTPAEILSLLEKSGFGEMESRQTIFHPLSEIKSLEKVERGYGRGAFVVIKGHKA